MKGKNYGYYWGYRSPRTTQERKQYEPHKKYVRAKRSKRMLPNSYDDIQTAKKEKSWKVRRKTQYRCGKRPKPQKIWLDWKVCEFTVKQYLEQMDIPYKFKEVYEEIEYVRYDGKIVTSTHLKGYFLIYWSKHKLILPQECFRYRMWYRN